MNTLTNLIYHTMEFLKGKKTYITGFVMVVLGILQEDTQVILTGLGLIFLRNGVS